VKTTFLAAVLVFLTVRAAHAEPWPGWRGPTGMGQSQHRDLPLTWDGKTMQNVLWKVPLLDNKDKVQLDQNQSSPIVHGEHVFVTISYWPPASKKDTFPEHHVVCFHTKDGKRLWDTVVPPGPWLLKDLRGGYTAPTPASDGERVYALFGSSVIAALDLKGNIVWRKEITPHAFDVALGTSPVLYQDNVLVICEQLENKSVLIAFDKKTGNLAWQRKRPDADWTHSTPVLAKIGGKTQLLAAGATAIQGLDPADGQPLWWCKTGTRTGDTPSVVVGAGLVYCDSGRGGGLGGKGVAVDPSGTGDVTKTHLKWSIAKISEGFSSPVIVGEHLYRLHNPELLSCWDMTTGKLVYSTERLQGISTSASPIATPDGRIYCASSGRSYVVRAGAKFELLATNDLGDPSQASPAVADGKIYFKGRSYLFCIGSK
jgi:outer membrane protein assembly factor BamB